MEQLINTWGCDACGDSFYTALERKPESCPFCNSTELADSKVFEIKPIK